VLADCLNLYAVLTVQDFIAFHHTFRWSCIHVILFCNLIRAARFQSLEVHMQCNSPNATRLSYPYREREPVNEATLRYTIFWGSCSGPWTYCSGEASCGGGSPTSEFCLPCFFHFFLFLCSSRSSLNGRLRPVTLRLRFSGCICTGKGGGGGEKETQIRPP